MVQFSTSNANRQRIGVEYYPALGRYVTPREARTLPVYNWFVYPHSYSPRLVGMLIDRFELTENDRIFDPFVGAGTTLLYAKERGISAVGLDLLPVSGALTMAKIATYDLPQLAQDVAATARMLARSTPLVDPANDPLLEMAADPATIIARAYAPATLREIVRIKGVIVASAKHPLHQTFLLVGLLALAEKFSATRKSGGWLKMADPPPLGRSLTQDYLARLARMLRDLAGFQRTLHHGTWTVKIGDARTSHPELGRFTAVISSPPYLNRHDYTRVLSLELLIGFLELYDDLKELRYRLLRSHVEAKDVLSPLGYTVPAAVKDVLAELAVRDADPRVLRIVAGYFEDLYAVLGATRQVLTPDGRVAFVLGNVRFSGVTIPVDEIVAEIGEAVGLRCDSILVARHRNNSAQQMRAFGRTPSRESVILWRNS